MEPPQEEEEKFEPVAGKYELYPDDENPLEDISWVKLLQFELPMINEEISSFKKDNKLSSLLKNQIGLIQAISLKIIGYTQIIEVAEDMKLLVDLMNKLKIYENQLSMLEEIIFAEKEDISNILESMASLQSYLIPAKSKEDLCIPVIIRVSCFIEKKVLVPLQTDVDQFGKRVAKAAGSSAMKSFKIAAAHLGEIVFYCPKLFCLDKRDLFALPADDDSWKLLNKYSEFKEFVEKEKLEKGYKKFVKNIILCSAALSKTTDYATEAEKKLAMGLYSIYYFFLSGQALLQYNCYVTDPQEKVSIQVWNLFERSPLVKKYAKTTFPAVGHHQKIFTGRHFEAITKEALLKAKNDGVYNCIVPDPKFLERGEKGLLEDVKIQMIINKEIFNKNGEGVKVRIIHAEKLDLLPNICKTPRKSNFKEYPEPFTEGPIPQHQQSRTVGGLSGIFSGWFQCCGPRDKNQPPFNDKKQKERVKPDIDRIINEPEKKKHYFKYIVMHIHGGGFVSGSSMSHQVYTRLWTKKLGVPVFSVDYGLSPENSYPKGLDDCWQVYCWLRVFSSEFLNIKLEKIIIAGDSAGANIALGITARAIQLGISPPDGLFLAYPALNLNLLSATPSWLLALHDLIIPSSVLKMCVRLYIDDESMDAATDPFISPILLSNEILQNFPPVRIMVGDIDPLHDDCWRFTQRLLENKRDIKLSIYRNMPHGFLNYGFPGGMSEAKEYIEDSIRILGELIRN